MKVCGIICEYNPFHNGHKYQIEILKEKYGFDGIVCAMSGNYTQRGDIAIYDKHVRAKAALRGGANLVLEIPAIHAMETAEKFARNGVYILSKFGAADALAFGAECADVSLLKKIAELLVYEPPKFKESLKTELDFGKPFFAARAAAVEHILGKSASDVLSKPNNILAVEYIKAILRLKSHLLPIGTERVEAGHNDTTQIGKISSSSAIRNALLLGDGQAFKGVPDDLIKLYKGAHIHNAESLSTAVISKILLSKPKDFEKIADMREGLENKLWSEARKSKSLDELCRNVKSKRYALSGIRRVVLGAFLGITKSDMAALPKYIKILDFDETGREILHKAKKISDLPLAANRKSLKNNPSALEIWDRELLYDDIYDLT